MQPPYPQLAKEFMDLWQKQIASVVSDKQFIQSMLEMLESMKMPHVKPTAQPADTSDAPGSDAGLHAQLAYRLAMCERRIAALEKAAAGTARPKKTGRKPAPRSKKPVK